MDTKTKGLNICSYWVLLSPLFSQGEARKSFLPGLGLKMERKKRKTIDTLVKGSIADILKEIKVVEGNMRNLYKDQTTTRKTPGVKVRGRNYQVVSDCGDDLHISYQRGARRVEINVRPTYLDGCT